MRRIRLARRGCCLVGVLMVLGCGDSGLPDTAPVSGKVTWNGKPLPNAEVVFVPREAGRSASGRTDSEGRYQLGTLSIADGAVLGKHRVGIIARGPDRPLRPGEMGVGVAGETALGEPLIPEKYFTPETSGLDREVVSGSNQFDFDLKLE